MHRLTSGGVGGSGNGRRCARLNSGARGATHAASGGHQEPAIEWWHSDPSSARSRLSLLGGGLARMPRKGGPKGNERHARGDRLDAPRVAPCVATTNAPPDRQLARRVVSGVVPRRRRRRGGDEISRKPAVIWVLAGQYGGVRPSEAVYPLPTVGSLGRPRESPKISSE